MPPGLCVQCLSFNQGLSTSKSAMGYVGGGQREEALTEVTVLSSVDIN